MVRKKTTRKFLICWDIKIQALEEKDKLKFTVLRWEFERASILLQNHVNHSVPSKILFKDVEAWTRWTKISKVENVNIFRV